MKLKTSETDPLEIAEVQITNQQKIGLSFCPGKYQLGAMSGNWRRHIGTDLELIEERGYDVVVSLIESHEFVELRVESFHDGAVQKVNMKWIWVPIVDGETPTHTNHSGLNEVLDEVKSGKSVFVHCKGGLGRAGSVAAWLLTHFEWSANDAISKIRDVRKDAIENVRQESWIVENAGLLLSV